MSRWGPRGVQAEGGRGKREGSRRVSKRVGGLGWWVWVGVARGGEGGGEGGEGRGEGEGRREFKGCPRLSLCGQTLNNDGLLSVWSNDEDCPVYVRDAYFLNQRDGLDSRTGLLVGCHQT